MHIVLTSLTALAAVLLIPRDAYAWGPATHLELGRELIHASAILPVAMRGLINKYTYDFFYGSISADIVVAKNFTQELKHCHNWKFGFKLLDRARNESQKAFAYGYLSHLAADTIAHNHFIPEMMVRSFSTRIHRHIYWEMRFDALADKHVWKLPKKMARAIHLDNDRLLGSTLEGTLLSFSTNKTIFSGIINLHRIEHWHSMMALLSTRSKWALHKEDKDRFFGLALDAVKNILTHGKKARCVKKDPTGKENLALAKGAKKRLKSIKRSGGSWEEPLKRALENFILPEP